MKTIFNLFLVTMSLGLVILLSSGKPVSNAARSAAQRYIVKLSNDVQLTDSQKIAINEYALIYFNEKLDMKSKKDKNEYKSKGKLLGQDFKNHINAILNQDQKDSIAVKIERRKLNGLSN